ncbi:hypothetical protein QAD02_006569 [Eretmocerus hayati]|uniref:Uncharacterized protein n=1 Tax=Eretmocerus hayati TaxID=131215 RepID=A0ACC2N1C0_9HYME|nr:hypothetical protein QAD02_006569 [Eretmocerus hayati]
MIRNTLIPLILQEPLDSGELQGRGLDLDYNNLDRPKRSYGDEEDDFNVLEPDTHDSAPSAGGFLNRARTDIENEANRFVDNESEHLKETIAEKAENVKGEGEKKVDKVVNYVESQGDDAINKTVNMVGNTYKSVANTGFDYLASIGLSKSITDNLSNFTNLLINSGQEIAQDVGHSVVQSSSNVLKSAGEGLVSDSVDTAENAGIEETDVVANSAKETVHGVLNIDGTKLKDAAVDFAKGSVDTGRDATKGVIKSVSNAAGNLTSGALAVGVNAAESVGQLVINKASDVAKDHIGISPNIVNAVEEDLKSFFEGAGDDVKDVAEAAISGVKDSVDKKYGRRVDHVADSIKSRI